MKTLQEIYENHKGPDGWGDKGTAHTYINEYERLLKSYRKNSTVLEIGICYGHSMEMWCDYFINSEIIGVDVENKNLPEDTRYKKIFCDASTPDILQHISNYKFDVIIDDGSHLPHHQIDSFNLLKDYLKPKGIYIIEDVNNLEYIKSNLQPIEDTYHIEIIDNRHKLNRYDDILVVIKKK